MTNLAKKNNFVKKNFGAYLCRKMANKQKSNEYLMHF